VSIETNTKDNRETTLRLEAQIKNYEQEISAMKQSFNEIKTVLIFFLNLFTINK
jgi:hypothetical protein